MDPETGEIDHCRIGSLEIKYAPIATDFVDHCRIGSLEKAHEVHENDVFDHCRIGSLEIVIDGPKAEVVRSLPHRQLRN